MSELDPDMEAELARAPPIPTVQTSRLAIFAALGALLCIPGLSGLLGLVLGVLALRQINASSTIQGGNLAYAGIIGGIFNLFVWGSVGWHMVQVRGQLESPTAAFVGAWTSSEAEGEAAAAPGLAPLMRHGEGELIRRTLAERLGPFRGLGPRDDFDYKLDIHGEHISAVYPLRFQSGAPCRAEFEYVTLAGKPKVVGFRLDSPVLRDLAMNGQTELHGDATPELQDFGGGGSSAPGSRVKGYKH